jgi:hypothetical protein
VVVSIQLARCRSGSLHVRSAARASNSAVIIENGRQSSALVLNWDIVNGHGPTRARSQQKSIPPHLDRLHDLPVSDLKEPLTPQSRRSLGGPSLTPSLSRWQSEDLAHQVQRYSGVQVDHRLC